MLNSILKVVRGIVKLRGNTDNSLIGNVGDRLKVDVGSTSSTSELDSNLVFSAGIKNVNAPSSGNNNPLILFRNPSGSGKAIYIKAILINVTINGVYADFGLYASPTVTVNGTTVNGYTRTVGSGVSPVALVTTVPTVTSPGNLLGSYTNGQNCTVLNLLPNNYLKLLANQSILITADPQSNNRNFDATIVWTEI
jgi:hypothetical protein